MAENSTIEWTDHTFNPWMGCTKVSPGCDHCYAERSTPARAFGVIWGNQEERRRTTPATWKAPLKWNAAHGEFFAQHGRRQRVFCASLADVFDNQVPDEWRRDLFTLIDKTPNIDWLLLTKRIGNVNSMMEEACGFLEPSPGCFTPRENVWIGLTITNQGEADRDIPKLLQVPAAVRFLSMEPLLSAVDLRWIPGEGGDKLDVVGGWRNEPAGPNIYESRIGQRINWVIVGGESGHDARPMHPEWVRSLRDQCADAGVPFLFKQWGEWAPGECARNTLAMRTVQTADWFVDGWRFNTIPGDSEFHVDDEPTLYRTGKKAAGRLLDGVQHDGFPEVKSVY